MVLTSNCADNIFAKDSATGSFNNSSSATFLGRSRGTDNVMTPNLSGRHDAKKSKSKSRVSDTDVQDTVVQKREKSFEKGMITLSPVRAVSNPFLTQDQAK